MYAEDGYYWGREPNAFARKALGFVPKATGTGRPRAVDLGAGEGRDAAFFAANGLDVMAVDVAPNGLRKAVRLARERGVEVAVQAGDINSLKLEGPFDLVYSVGTLQYLLPQNRRARFEHLREQTAPGGVNALFAFVEHPDLPPAPDLMPDERLYAPGELPAYYPGWEILYSRAYVFEDDSGGVPHRHAAEEYVFGKPH